MPNDNVQKFETLCEDALFLQGMADTGDQVDDINFLMESLQLRELHGFPVDITGGLVEVKAINENLDEVSAFVLSEDSVAGEYQGMSWRSEIINFPDGTSEACWRICHSIGSSPSSFVDEDGDKVVRTPITNVTVEGSELEIISPVGAHDYRAIALDGICHIFDELGLDEDIDKTSKANLIAKMLRTEKISEATEQYAKMVRQRISYLNELGIFDHTLVLSPIALRRTDLGTEMLKSSGSEYLTAEVKYIAIDEEVNADYEWIEDTSTISYEVELPGYGHVSVPHINGVTKVFDLWRK